MADGLPFVILDGKIIPRAEAWQRREFGTVVNAYSEIEAELPAVGLKPSERARLGYALKALSGGDD